QLHHAGVEERQKLPVAPGRRAGDRRLHPVRYPRLEVPVRVQGQTLELDRLPDVVAEYAQGLARGLDRTDHSLVRGLGQVGRHPLVEVVLVLLAREEARPRFAEHVLELEATVLRGVALDGGIEGPFLPCDGETLA